MDALGPFLFILFLIIFFIRMIKNIGKPSSAPPEDQERVYEVRQEEIQKILQQLGMAPKQPTAKPPQAPQRPTPAQRLAKPGGVVPSAPRRTAGPGAWPPPEPKPSRSSAQPERTRRVVPEEERLTPTVEKHLRERRLSEGESPLVPTVEEHLEQRHLDSDQLSLTPTIEAHLEESRLAETPEMEAITGVTGEKRRAGIRRRRGAAAQTGRNEVRGKRFIVPPLDVHGLRQAFVLSEILSPPLALRPPRDLPLR